MNSEGVKVSMVAATSLSHYDRSEPITIETYLSSKELGPVLIQKGITVRYVSKSLTPTEMESANIERELLTVKTSTHVATSGQIEFSSQLLQDVKNWSVYMMPIRVLLLLFNELDARFTSQIFKNTFKTMIDLCNECQINGNRNHIIWKDKSRRLSLCKYWGLTLWN
ncbi:unnamed protein product [Lepeophtheirus salmonis]|uniref:(salmon louse) hypothetical protein n=1 Tax=Lepeophtheirus salmonis TaxID=72036 RepID=A0A7R8HCR0_LEPSM|nr:unnamed protein product [Lepeophtheirus salmonis]CAF2996413.1 unnamed protein product [Lepeophtheirus salmonis]